VDAARRTSLGIGLAFLSYASWGLLSPMGKHFLGSGAYLPNGLNAVRFGLAAVVFLAVAGPRSFVASLRLLRRRDLLTFNALANLSLTLFLYSLAMLPQATYATLGFYTAPLWTAVLAHVILRERAGPWFPVAAAALLAGGYLTLFGFAPPPAGFSAGGLALAIASGLVWAWYTVLLRKSAPDIPLKPLMGASFIFGAAWFALLALVLEGPPALLHQTGTSWALMAVYVAVPTLASFILFNAALQRAPAGMVNLLVGAELGFTAIFAALLYHDAFSLAQVLGLAVVLVAVTAYLWVQAKGQPAPPPAG